MSQSILGRTLLIQPANPSHQVVQPANPFHQVVQPANPSHQVVQLANPSHQVVQPANPSHQVVQPANPSHQVVQLVNPSHQVVQLANPSHQVVQPANPSHQVVQLANPSHQVVQPANLSHQIVQPSNPSHQVVQPANLSHQVVQPSNPSHQVVQLANPSHQVVQPANPSHQVVQSSNPSHQVVQPANPSHQVVQLANPSHQVVQPANPSHQVVQPAVQLLPPQCTYLQSTDSPDPLSLPVDNNAGAIQSTKDDLSFENVSNKGRLKYPDLVFIKTVCEKKEALEVVQRSLYSLPGNNHLSVARILFLSAESNGFTYDVQVLFTSIRAGTVKSLADFFAVCDIISRVGEYKFCPGFDVKRYYDEYHSVIRYHINGVRKWEKPFSRMDSKSCLLWHQLAKNASKEDKLSFAVMCKNCKRLQYNLDIQKRRSTVSPARRIARQQPSSSFKLKYLSPASVAQRKKATQTERSADKTKLARCAELEVTLDDEQSDELTNIMNKIEEANEDELEKIFNEADEHSVGESIRAAWESNRQSTQQKFFKDQQINSKCVTINSTCYYLFYREWMPQQSLEFSNYTNRYGH